MTSESSKPISLKCLMDTLENIRTEAEQQRDKIALDANDANQKNWFFFNGKVDAITNLESQIRLHLKTFPLPNVVEIVEEGKLFITLSNQERVSLMEDRENLHIGQVDPSGEDWWICSINRNGVLCAPNSGSACEVLAANLGSTVEKEDDKKEHQTN